MAEAKNDIAEVGMVLEITPATNHLQRLLREGGKILFCIEQDKDLC